MWDGPPGLSSSWYKGVLTYYERHLPHWQLDGAAIFLTWRLHGSLPGTAGIFAAMGKEKSAGKAFVTMDRTLDKAEIGPRWL
jgi:hypothetical protein